LRPKRDALGRFAPKTVKVKRKKPAVKTVPKKKVTVVKKSAAKKAAKKRTAKPHVLVNDWKVGFPPARPIMRIAALIALTAVPPDLAIVRVNGTNVTGQKTVRLNDGDEITIRRRVKKRKKKVAPPSKRPKKGKRIRKKKTELVGKIKEIVWVDAFDEEWLRKDGSVAFHPSHVRSFAEADKWHEQYLFIKVFYGPESEQMKEFAKNVAEKTDRPIQEVYTLFFSP
jgi:hypothetical protein